DGGMRRVTGWLTAAIIITLIFGSSYTALQQLGRRSANAAPAAAAAAKAQLIGSETLMAPWTELTPESGVFVIVYGSDDKPESGTVTLHGSIPVLPAGVLQAARDSGSDAVTWQPEPGLRMAVVARPAAGKVVVAGQSLTPYEDRDRMVLTVLAAGWLGSLGVLTAGYAATGYFQRRRPPPLS
ncbi:MAG: hypothetical protein JWM47_4073, partial [Acidimicrobiales bacterium]|nr:hypothetical protein [Acidimicrobiales bacterium]